MGNHHHEFHQEYVCDFCPTTEQANLSQVFFTHIPASWNRPFLKSLCAPPDFFHRMWPHTHLKKLLHFEPTYCSADNFLSSCFCFKFYSLDSGSTKLLEKKLHKMGTPRVRNGFITPTNGRKSMSNWELVHPTSNWIRGLQLCTINLQLRDMNSSLHPQN